MKFFSNLPKTTFESSIGNFTISDFFTYLDVDQTFIDEATIDIDDKTTLLEAASTYYGDVNSFWSFVAANNTINPFDLLAPNTFLFSNVIGDKINLTLLSSPTSVTGGSAFPIGSILVPYIGNTGSSYTYGSTGNFNINGPFAVIEDTSFYDGNMVIGTQTGGTGPFIIVGATSERVVVLKKNDDGSYTYGGNYYTGNKKTYATKVVQQVINYDGKVIFKETTSSYPTIDSIKQAPPPIPDDEGGGVIIPIPTTPETSTVTKYTVLDKVVQHKKSIKAYIPSQLGLVQSSFVTTKYI